MIRRKHGLCLKCGYDLRGNSGGGGEVCPECGEPCASGVDGHRSVTMALFTRLMIASALLGLATTIIVAWTLALCVDPRAGRSNLDFLDLRSEGRGLWEVHMYSSDRGTVKEMTSHCVEQQYHSVVTRRLRRRGGLDRSLIPAWSHLLDRSQPSIAKETELQVWERASGWPLTCLMYRVSWEWAAGSGGLQAAGDLTGGISIPKGWRVPAELAEIPITPVWPGFLFDIAIFMGLWSCLLGALRVIRATLRRVKGRCTRCGYDLRGNSGGGREVCPECGTSTS